MPQKSHVAHTVTKSLLVKMAIYELIYGIFMEYLWNIYGILMEYLWFSMAMTEGEMD